MSAGESVQESLVSMQKVQGIGGFCCYAKNPEALGRCYPDNSGLSIAPTDMNKVPRVSDAGVMVFAPFAEDTGYFAADQRFMLNFRESDLDGMVTQLESAGMEVYNRQETQGIGHFAHLRDLEGTPIELWEPTPTGDSE